MIAINLKMSIESIFNQFLMMFMCDIKIDINICELPP